MREYQLAGIDQHGREVTELVTVSDSYTIPELTITPAEGRDRVRVTMEEGEAFRYTSRAAMREALFVLGLFTPEWLLPHHDGEG